MNEMQKSTLTIEFALERVNKCKKQKHDTTYIYNTHCMSYTSKSFSSASIMAYKISSFINFRGITTLDLNLTLTKEQFLF